MSTVFAVTKETVKEILEKICPELLEVFLDNWVYCHSKDTFNQAKSVDAITKLHNLGYKFDIITKDGKQFDDVHINDAHVKLIYNCSVMAPANGVILWRPVPKPKTFINEALIGKMLISTANTSRKLESVQAQSFKIEQPFESKGNHNKYLREIKPGVFIDVYDVLRAFNVTDPCIQHAIKKQLMPGTRGAKDSNQDIMEAIQSLERSIQMQKEWGNV